MQFEVTAVLTALRGFAEFAKRAHDADVLNHVLLFQEAYNEERRARMQLEEEVDALRKKVEFATSLTFNGIFYRALNDPIPFCPHCWETEREARHLMGVHRSSYGTSWPHLWSMYKCTRCDNMFDLSADRELQDREREALEQVLRCFPDEPSLNHETPAERDTRQKADTQPVKPAPAP